VRSWDFPAHIGVVAQPCEASWEARLPSGLCVAPLRLRGLRGKKSTPSDWLGGTGVGLEQEWHGAGAARSARTSSRWALRQRYAHVFSRVECIVIYFGDYDCIIVKMLIQLL
jgi:hypothetical protein